MRRLAIAVLILILVGGVVYAATCTSLPRLRTEGNQIIRTDTGTSVTLRGVVSDYFRFGGGNRQIYPRGIKSEFTVLAQGGDQGANVVGLYLSDPERISLHIDELDTYIQTAKKYGMYVYLLPVAREFNETDEAGDQAPQASFNDLTELMRMLSKRYADEPAVLYGIGAEPEGETFTSWFEKQRTVAAVIRENAPNGMLVITADRYQQLIEQFLEKPFPYDNVLYLGGGYTTRGDAEMVANPNAVAVLVRDIARSNFAEKYPYMAGEFGGNWGQNFSSERDLQVISDMLVNLNAADANYTMYRLSSNNPEDQLSLYSKEETLTRRGEVFVSALSAHPPTQFKSSQNFLKLIAARIGYTRF